MAKFETQVHRMSMHKWVALIDEISRQTPRGAAIMAGALLENRLRDAIEHRLLECDVKWKGEKISFPKGLFAFQGSLGSFRSKIDMSLTLGIIGPETWRELMHIKSIRNAFAHSDKPLKFNSERIKDLCNNLNIGKRFVPLGKKTPPRKNNYRGIFLNSVFTIFNLVFSEITQNESHIPKPKYLE